MSEALCPYCEGRLEPKPKRKRKCPYCGGDIYVRRGELYTEQGMKEYEVALQEHHALERMLRRLAPFGVTQSRFERERANLTRQFGSQASVNDTAWSLLNNVLLSQARSNHDRKMIYLEMVFIMRDEGRDPSHVLVQAARCDLLAIRENGPAYSRVQIFTCNDDDVCSACRAMENQTFLYDEALETLPVPNRCTSEHGCRCWYGPVIDIDEMADLVAGTVCDEPKKRGVLGWLGL